MLIELHHQDFHLAKRHYDLAYETNSEAYLPVLLSLAKLYIRSIWHTLMGGKDGLNIWYPEDEETSELYMLFYSYLLLNITERYRGEGDRRAGA